MSDSSFKAAYERMCQALDAHTQIKLAGKIKVTQPSISNACKREAIPETWLYKIQEDYRINRLWIKHGTGNMILSPLPPKPPKPTEYETQKEGGGFIIGEPPALYGSLTPVYSCHCDYLENAPHPPLTIIARDSFPSKSIKEGVLVIYYETSGFEPAIRKNAYVGIDTTQKNIVPGELYAIFMPLEGLALKRIYPDKNHANYILKVDSDAYVDTSLSIEQVSSRLLGRAFWTLHNV